MDSSDWSVRCRLSIVYNEFGILEYYDRHYLEAIDHLTTSIQYNPRIGAYYLSRARARYMIEVTIKKEFWLNTFFVLFLRPLFATWRDEEAWLTARSQALPKSGFFCPIYSSQSNRKRRSSFFETFSVTSIFSLLSRILITAFSPDIRSKTSPTARPALEYNDFSEKHEGYFNPSEALLSICKLFTLQASLIIKTCRQICRLQIGFYTDNFAKGRWVGTCLDGVYYLLMEAISLLFYQKLSF